MKVVAVLLALIVPLAAYFPTIAIQRQEQQERADEQLHQLDQRVEQALSAQRKMQQFLEEGAHLATELEQLRVTLPPKLTTADILRTLESAATRHGVRLTRFAPRPPGQWPPLQVVSIETEAEGPSIAIETLLRELGEKPQPGQRFLAVSGVTAAGTRTSFVVTGYALPDPR